MIRVLIAEDQGMVRGALASLIALEPDIEVVSQVARGDEVLAAAHDVRARRRPARHRDAGRDRPGGGRGSSPPSCPAARC